MLALCIVKIGEREDEGGEERLIQNASSFILIKWPENGSFRCNMYQKKIILSMLMNDVFLSNSLTKCTDYVVLKSFKFYRMNTIQLPFVLFCILFLSFCSCSGLKFSFSEAHYLCLVCLVSCFMSRRFFIHTYFSFCEIIFVFGVVSFVLQFKPVLVFNIFFLFCCRRLLECKVQHITLTHSLWESCLCDVKQSNWYYCMYLEMPRSTFVQYFECMDEAQHAACSINTLSFSIFKYLKKKSIVVGLINIDQKIILLNWLLCINSVVCSDSWYMRYTTCTNFVRLCANVYHI